ncbi:hypothetical protein Kim5_CH00785 [Rhizobium sp. Kim5]|uniref:hypothetical protein n=1 Tax=Rhizobium sp. Kim5 TaxID=2020311 RepID=UPI0001905F3A|nr:hypothetical protein [Rhizobium sp. Kim5]ARQ56893.1 hypothetical protein Kim5_CH00785 [Rhizobium sp. Kim5]
MIIPAEYESLNLLCWNRDPQNPIERCEAWAIYKRDWRLVWQDTLDEAEIALIKSLQDEFGEVLLGTDGLPPPWAQRDT